MSNYTKTNVGYEGRTELHEVLSLTGAEVSVNSLPAGASVPFVHSHRNNEEIYGVIAGKGTAIIDGNKAGQSTDVELSMETCANIGGSGTPDGVTVTVEITAGDWLKISPKAQRQFFAASDSSITYICIQVKENSLEGFTVNDAVIY